jgi:hypothetical protein
MMVVIFLPGGLVEGGQRIAKLLKRGKKDNDGANTATTTKPAE